jgi:hypothetical protein
MKFVLEVTIIVNPANSAPWASIQDVGISLFMSKSYTSLR